ncbi:hypothetical protein D3C87_1018220 [compost metagenome]
MVDGRLRAQVGAVETQAARGQGHLGRLPVQPQPPLGIGRAGGPGQGVVQHRRPLKLMRCTLQAVVARIVRTADGRQPFVHQLARCQAGKVAVAVMQGQVNLSRAKVHAIISHAQIDRHVRILRRKACQARHEPALGDGRARMHGDAARERIAAGQRRMQAIPADLQRGEDALAILRQLYLPRQALEQAQTQARFQPRNAVADGAGRERQFLRGQRKTGMARRHEKRVQVGELAGRQRSCDRRTGRHQTAPAASKAWPRAT